MLQGKIICMERNRRVAKAYARSPIISIDSSHVGFNGDTIGLTGFDNPFRDQQILAVHRSIGDGIIVAVDEDGNVLIDVVGKTKVTVREAGHNSLTGDFLTARGLIRGTSNKVFDMRKFLRVMNKEFMSDEIRVPQLENCCFTFVTFTPETDMEIIDAPVWIIIINIIAMEMLHRNLQLSESIKLSSQQTINFISNSWSLAVPHVGHE